ncbi:MAG: hypothetical protein QM676_12790 [Novosphingobium sp.]
MIAVAEKFGALLAATSLAIGAGAMTAEAKPRLTGQERLAQLTAGRVAGAPVSCISQSDRSDMEIVDKTAIVYGSGRTIYVNQPRNASDLDSDDILVTSLHGSQLCKLDSVRLHDRSTQANIGFVMLGDFVPYRRVESAQR